jgi:hypothetical protein
MAHVPLRPTSLAKARAGAIAAAPMASAADLRSTVLPIHVSLSLACVFGCFLAR